MQSRKKLKSYLLKGLFFLLTLIAIDFVIGKILKKSYNNQKYGDDYNTIFAIEKATPQTLIIGSSRAANIFDPCVFKDELNTKTFNAGRVGQSIFYHYAILKASLKRYNPEIVILSIDRRDFAVDRSDYDRLSELLPFYEKHPEIRSIIDLKGPYEKLKLLSSIYPYNSLILPIIKGYIYDKSKVNYKGYKPLTKIITKPLPKINYDLYSVLDTTKIATYKALIEDCQKAGIKLFITCPPYLVQATGIDASIDTAKKIAGEYSIPFFDHAENTYYITKAEYFADFRHLNEDGAFLFSKETAAKIKEVLNKRN